MNRKVSIKARLNLAGRAKNGLYPLVIQVIYKRCKRIIYTPYRVDLKSFDPVREIVLPSDKRAEEMNMHVASVKYCLTQIVEQLETRGRDFEPDEVITGYNLKYKGEQYLVSFISQLIAEMIAEGRLGSSYTYRSVLAMLQRLYNAPEVKIVDITPHFLRRLHRLMCLKGLKSNSIALYMNILSAVYNKAIERSIVKDGTNPFRRLNIRRERTLKRAAGSEIIGRIMRFTSPSESLTLSKDLFMFSFYTRGMSFVDVINLRHTDISYGVITYRRRKTGQLIRIRVTGQISELISKYSGNPEYVFPVLSGANPNNAYIVYKNALKKHNRNLERIAGALKLDIKLTSYVARHSWATIAKHNGIPISVISEGLGHANEKTTAIYLDSFSSDVVDRANDIVVASLNGKRVKAKNLFTAYNTPDALSAY